MVPDSKNDGKRKILASMNDIAGRKFPASLNGATIGKPLGVMVAGDRLALTPHMGWNSWYIWMDSVTDKITRDAADAMVANGMIDHGYTYVNIDESWEVKPDAKDPINGGPTRDAQGRMFTDLSNRIACPKRNPDSGRQLSASHIKHFKPFLVHERLLNTTVCLGT
jgi:hypothetical protein